jgi:hypothetical protein
MIPTPGALRAAIHRQAVHSANLKSVGYDAPTHTLAVEFHDGGLYHFQGVPLALYEGLMNAKSKGTYFAERVKPRFRGVKG